MSQQQQQQQQQSQQQQLFCDQLNNNHSVHSEPTVSFQIYQENHITSDVVKRRLADVPWSHTMEVSEEKRFKMNKNEQ